MQPGQAYTNNSGAPQNVSFQGQGADSGMSYDKNGNNIVASPQEIAAAGGSAPQVNLGNGVTGTLVPEAGTGYTPEMAAQQQKQKSYAENAANYKGIIKEGEELGTARGKDIADLGKQQLDLSTSGMILDHLTGITQNPEFQNMRSQVPYFQDKQLWYLSKNGSPAQQKLIGDFVSTAQAFKASTVNSFKGKALEKEFNLADKIKIDENDTMGVAEGKLRSLKTLKQIAETKNDIILGYMTNQHMNLGEATKKANKMVDTSAIEKQVDSVLNPQPSEHDIQYMMQKRNLPRDEIVKQLKAKGYKNVS
jgi:NACalpha-BTF3-like transcription factor